MKALLIFFLVGFASNSFGQNIYGSVSYGAMGYHCKYTDIQDSYTSYIDAFQAVLDANNLSYTRTDDNFSNNGAAGALIIQLGVGQNGYSFVFTSMTTRTAQERNVEWSNGFGRTFVWKEFRRESLFDFGFYGTKNLDFYGTFGVNSNWSKMIAYYKYPDGSHTLSQEFSYNGVYKHYSVGLSFGAGFRYRFKNFLALECRYLFSKMGIGATKTDDFGLSDNSIVKDPTYSYFPEDYSKPIGLLTGNEVVPYFNRQSITLSALFYLNLDEIKKNKEK